MSSPIGDSLIHETAPSRTRYVGKTTVLSFLIGAGCAVLWTSSGSEQPFVGQGPATYMALRPQPMQMQAARTHKFMQPLRASKSPFGVLDIVLPITSEKSKVPVGELDIMVPVTKREMMTPGAEVKKVLESPVTKREMMAATAAAAVAAVTPGVAHADDEEKYTQITGDLARFAKEVIVSKANAEKVPKLRQDINYWVATYRRQSKFTAKPSYGTMYGACNAIAGHYSSFGPTAPIPKKRLDRVLLELDQTLTRLERGK